MKTRDRVLRAAIQLLEANGVLVNDAIRGDAAFLAAVDDVLNERGETMPNKTQRKPTLAAGATIQRSLVRRKLRRFLSIYGLNPTKDYNRGWSDCCQRLDAWLYGEPERAKKPRGIGPK